MGTVTDAGYRLISGDGGPTASTIDPEMLLVVRDDGVVTHGACPACHAAPDRFDVFYANGYGLTQLNPCGHVVAVVEERSVPGLLERVVFVAVRDAARAIPAATKPTSPAAVAEARTRLRAIIADLAGTDSAAAQRQPA